MATTKMYNQNLKANFSTKHTTKTIQNMVFFCKTMLRKLRILIQMECIHFFMVTGEQFFSKFVKCVI